MQKTKTLKECVDELNRWEVHFGRSGQRKDVSYETRKKFVELANVLNKHVAELKKTVEQYQNEDMVV
jgi:hypothetical protein